MRSQHIVPCAVCMFLLLSLHLFAQQQPPAYLKEYQSKGLPPIGPRIEFEDKTVFPPQPKGVKQTETKLDYQTPPTPPTPAAVRAVRDIALSNTKVKQVLGKRFSYLGTDSIEAPTDRALATTAPTTVMRYYSYTRNRAIDVYLADDKVVEIRQRPQGYQPAEDRDEVAEATEMVRADKRYHSIVTDLPARGLVTPSTNGNRYLYVLFY